MQYTPLNVIYELYRQVGRVVLHSDLVGQGDLYLAYPLNRPLTPFLRFIWDVVETLWPDLLQKLIVLAKRYSVSIWLVATNENGANNFARRALARGAAYAVIDNSFYKRGDRYLLVKNVRQTLIGLANVHRRQVSIPVVAITGSNGKTTTKELVNCLLATQYCTSVTSESRNSIPHLPETLLAVDDATNMVVLEMGIARRGSLTELCQMALPTHGLITNIGVAHLRHLQTIDGVGAAKGELFAHLRATGGHIFVNGDDERVVALAEGYSRVTIYGQKIGAKIRGEAISTGRLLIVRWYLDALSGRTEYLDIQTQLVGQHNLHNVLAALAVGDHFGIPPATMARAIEGFRPPPNRFQLIQSGSNTFILDAYNANPSSMLAALLSFRQMTATYKIGILGDMLDLGRESRRAHRQILQVAQSLDLSALVLVGREFANVKNVPKGIYVDTVAEARRWLLAQKFENACILLKGSRALKLENILEHDD